MRGLTSKRNCKLKDPEFLKLFDNYDVLLFTETWTQEESDIEVKGFKYVAIHREKRGRAKRASGGIVVYFRSELANFVSLERSTEDCVLWVKIDKDAFNSETDLLLCTCYVLPAGSRRQHISCNVFDQVFDDVIELGNAYDNSIIIVAGDLNARTSEQTDNVASNDHDIDYLPVPDENEDIISERVSKDKKPVNSNGTNLLNLCKYTDLRILNGRVGADKGVGDYTCITPAGSSVVDYALCKSGQFDKIADFEVMSPSIYSDHCPIRIHLKLSCHVPEALNRNTATQKKYMWKADKAAQFVDALSAVNVNEQFATLFDEYGHADNKECIDNIVDGFTNIVQKVADPLFEKKFTGSRSHVNNTKPPWMTEECQALRYEYFRCLNAYRATICDDTRTRLTRARTLYSACVRKCKLEHDKEYTRKLTMAMTENAREFWKLLRPGRPQTQTSLGPDDFYEYFKGLSSNPENPLFTADEDVYDYVTNYVTDENINYDELNTPFTEEEVRMQ